MSDKSKNSVRILGTRGIPAKHGGFETFAQDLALYLVEQKNWQVTVYCQSPDKEKRCEEQWRGINLVHIPQKGEGALSTILFDVKAVLHSLRSRDKVLTLGYNTAFLNVFYRIFGIKNAINMDGIEWKRKKWKFYEKWFLYINEWFGAKFGHCLVADHPEIKKHLSKRTKAEKISIIPYSADEIVSSVNTDANKDYIKSIGVEPYHYFCIIARPEPENNILEIVKAFSKIKTEQKLLVLGNYNKERRYDRKVLAAANENVVFCGGIYDKDKVQAIRYFCRAYIHGHSVGGTNPSLVEAMGAANNIIAHDNKFNRWVVGEGADYFDNKRSLEDTLSFYANNEKYGLERKKQVSKRFNELFTHSQILYLYYKLLQKL